MCDHTLMFIQCNFLWMCYWSTDLSQWLLQVLQIKKNCDASVGLRNTVLSPLVLIGCIPTPLEVMFSRIIVIGQTDQIRGNVWWCISSAWDTLRFGFRY